jgi:hypothetical protein
MAGLDQTARRTPPRRARPVHIIHGPIRSYASRANMAHRTSPFFHPLTQLQPLPHS